MNNAEPDRHHSYDPLASRVERSATAKEISAAMVVLCGEIDAALSPILGARGVAALHNRSYHLLAARHDWMVGLNDAQASSVGCQGLLRLLGLLAQREPSEALVGGEAYLQTFHDLIVPLIGSSLSERLLRTVWPSTQ